MGGIFNETKIALSKIGKTFGAGLWGDAYSPVVIDEKGLKVGFLSYTEHQFGVLYSYEECKEGCAWINERRVNDDIEKLKSVVNYVIVIAHAGLEMIDVPLPEWRERYRELIDCGADVVVGGHPHTSQGYENYHNGLIFYSLGNFSFQQLLGKTMPESWWNGELLQLELSRYGIIPRLYGIRFDNNHIIMIEEGKWQIEIKRLNDLLVGDTYKNYVNPLVSTKK